MRCRMCNNDKLSKEFPPVTVSEKCKHPPLVCLQVSYRLNTVDWIQNSIKHAEIFTTLSIQRCTEAFDLTKLHINIYVSYICLICMLLNCCIFCYTFQCILSSSDTHCPSLSCEQLIQEDRREWFQAIWDKQFAEYKSSDVSVFETEPGERKVLHVTVLNGDAAAIEFNDSWTIMRLMTEIKKIMKFDINEQRLLYSGVELTVSCIIR